MDATNPAAVGVARPRSLLKISFDNGSKGFDAFREAIADFCSISVPQSEEGFHAVTHCFNVGASILTEVNTCSLCYERTAGDIARCGYDHYQIQLNLSGDSQVHSGRRSVVFRRGDIGIVDTVRATDTTVRAHDGNQAHCIGVFIPRKVLAPLFAAPDSEHCAVLRGDTTTGRLLSDHLVSFVRHADRLTATEATVAMQGLLGLVAAGFGPAADASLSLRQSMRHAVLASIKRYIEQHLDSDQLSAGWLCRRFGLSRATLYRLFEADGGLIGYVRGRRLQRAFRILMSPLRSDRILDIAMDCRFASDATFNRAFHRTFGLPPGELRALVHSRGAGRRSYACADENDERALIMQWIRRLAMPVRAPVTR